MYTLKYFVFTCVCVVCSYLTHKGNADIQHSLIFETTLVLLLKSNASRRRPPFVTLLHFFPSHKVCLLYWHFFFLLLIQISKHATFNFMFMFMSNCHACIFCVLYGVFELFINKKKFYLKDAFVRGLRGSFELDRVFFFLCVEECVHAKTRNCTFLKAF